VSDGLFLYVPAAIEIKVEINRYGLNVLISQAILDIREGLSLIEQIHSA
jgi:hypothetical protein